MRKREILIRIKRKLDYNFSINSTFAVIDFSSIFLKLSLGDVNFDSPSIFNGSSIFKIAKDQS